MFGMGMAELLVIAVVALLFVGPDKLPDAAKKLSKGIREFRAHGRELQKAIKEDEQIGSVVREIQSSLRDTEILEPAHPSQSTRRSRRARRARRSESEQESKVAQTTEGKSYENVSVRFYLSADEGASLADRLMVDLAFGVSHGDGKFVAERNKTLRVTDSDVAPFEEGDAKALLDLLVKLYGETGWPAP